MQDRLKTVTFRIGGMTCVNCRDKIQSALSEADGIGSAEVDYASATAVVTYDPQIITEAQIGEIVIALDYSVITDGARDTGAAKRLYPFLLFAVIVAAFVPLQYFGVLSYLSPGDIAVSGMGYGMLFVIGLLTSVHCIAMCGGINLSQCIPKPDGVRKGVQTFLPALLYNLGRVVSYTFIGLILGTVGWLVGGGSSVGVSSVVQGVFKIVAGLLMIVVGINLLGIIPALRKLNPTVPKFLAQKIGKRKSSVRSPFLVGLLNGIMPCGPLQSMWIVALATGNPFSGALSMFLFAMGTVPLMLGLGSVVSKLGQKFTATVMTVGSLLVVILGLAMLAQGGGLTGSRYLSPAVAAVAVLTLIFAGVVCSAPLKRKALRVAVRIASCCLVVVFTALAFWLENRSVIDETFDISAVGEDGQTVVSTLDAGTYPKIAVTAGIPVVWIINAPAGSLNGCNREIEIPEYGIVYTFQTGENVIQFTPEKTGTFRYHCWMGMIYGTIVVTQP